LNTSDSVYHHKEVRSLADVPDEEVADLAEARGFEGFVFIAGGADELDGGDIEELLKETKINQEV
jgi:hypothetical protein